VALIAAILTYALLALGGVVTSRDAGMIFPDWPLSNGSINPDGWLSNADKFSEHGHRILGALVGMATIALAVLIQRHDPRRWMKVLGWFALASVIAQGILGGARVWETDTFLALFHGCTGQIYFCLMVALAYFLSRDGRETPRPGADTTLVFAAAAGAAIATLYQIVLGAQVRHIRGPINDHLLGAVIVTGSVLLLVTLVFLRHGGRPRLVRPALLLIGLLVAQVVLGFSTASVLSPDNRTWDVTFAQIAMPSLHQAIGALLLAVEVKIALVAWRRRVPQSIAREVLA
jgi:cytochrome c oxidase assembly protein subunit 15